MSGFSPVTLSLLELVFVVALCLSILAVRRDHPDHVHTFTVRVFTDALLSVCVFFYPYEYSRDPERAARRNGWNDRSHVHEGFDGCSEGDIHPLTAGALLILPQILSYLINGILGCGFAIEAKALVLEESAEEITSTNDPDSEKAVYARVFQARADGRIEGTAEDVFETVQQVPET